MSDAEKMAVWDNKQLNVIDNLKDRGRVLVIYSCENIISKLSSLLMTWENNYLKVSLV